MVYEELVKSGTEPQGFQLDKESARLILIGLASTKNRRSHVEKKIKYEKPVLRKVRLEIKTSVLATCRTSTDSTPNAQGGPLVCYLNPSCMSAN